MKIDIKYVVPIHLCWFRKWDMQFKTSTFELKYPVKVQKIRQLLHFGLIDHIFKDNLLSISWGIFWFKVTICFTEQGYKETCSHLLNLTQIPSNKASFDKTQKPTTVKFIYSEKATKISEISTLLLSYVVPVKNKVEILQKILAFSEYMNFKNKFHKLILFAEVGAKSQQGCNISQ